jgi:hypothetical protein
MADSKSQIDTIQCPKCGEVIPISEALRRQVAEEARASLQKELAPREQALTAKEEKLAQKEASLKKEELALEARLQDRLNAERAKLKRSALETAKAEIAVQLQDLQKEAESKNKEVKKLRENELQLLQEKRQLQSAKENLELEVARKISEERAQIREAALKEGDEKHRLKDAERELQLTQARKANEELRWKLEQGSQQLQGEVLELDLEHSLRNDNPSDDISEVAKGVYGADVLQVVKNGNGLTAGTIIWEAKNTKNWNDGWIAKLKTDQMSAKADTAVIVSEVLPKGIDGFGYKDGVWVTSRKLVPALTLAIRHTLLEVAQTRRAAAGKNEVVEALFKYATGPEFQNRVETIVRNFGEMKEDLEAERKQTTRRWAKRSKQLDLIIVHTAGMYGDFQGLIGSSMHDIPALEGDQSESDGLELAASAEDEHSPTFKS